MTNKEHDWEFGIKEEGHTSKEDANGNIILGEGQFKYQTSGENWGNLPKGWVYKEATAVDVNSKDLVYVFNYKNNKIIFITRSGDENNIIGEVLCQKIEDSFGENNNFTKFTPHYITWYNYWSKVNDNFTKEATDECISGGRYCAPDPGSLFLTY